MCHHNNHSKTFICSGMYVLDGVQADRDSGIVNYGDNSYDGEGLVSNHRVLILLLEQEILFIDLTFPE